MRSSIDLAGFWVLWRELHVYGKGVATSADSERTVDRLRELGIARSTAYRHLADFKAAFGDDPRYVGATELVEVLRRRQQGALFPLDV